MVYFHKILQKAYVSLTREAIYKQCREFIEKYSKEIPVPAKFLGGDKFKKLMPDIKDFASKFVKV